MSISTKNHLRFILGAAIILMAWQSTAFAEDLLRVNGKPITLEQVEAVNPAAANHVAIRQQVAEQLAQQQLLADSAGEVPAAMSSKIDALQTNAKRQALAQLAAENYLKTVSATDTQIKDAYQKLVDALPAQQYWMRWIVVKTVTQADEILATLKTGKQNFATLSIEQSIGQNAELGGALGWQTEQTLPAAVLGVVRKLRVGQVAGPIPLDNGYAIVQLLAQRATPKPTLEQLKPQIEQQFKNAALQKHIQELAKNAKIENLMQTESSVAPTTNQSGEAAHVTP